MKIDVDKNALRDLLAITQRTIDGGEAYMFFSDDYTRLQLDAVVNLSLALREQIGHTPLDPSDQ